MGNESFYDHALTDIEKGKLLTDIDEIKRPFDNKELKTFCKDKRLFSILQNNCSKVVDKNGEPMVCYHGTEGKFDVFDKKFLGKEHGLEMGYGFYFSRNTEKAKHYGKMMACFLNIRNYFDNSYDSDHFWRNVWYFLEEKLNKKEYAKFCAEREKVIEIYNKTMQALCKSCKDKDKKEKAYLDAYINKAILYTEWLKKIGIDGVISHGSFGSYYKENEDNDGKYRYNEIVAFFPNQIKSATDNNGDFSPQKDSILEGI